MRAVSAQRALSLMRGGQYGVWSAVGPVAVGGAAVPDAGRVAPSALVNQAEMPPIKPFVAQVFRAALPHAADAREWTRPLALRCASDGVRAFSRAARRERAIPSGEVENA